MLKLRSAGLALFVLAALAIGGCANERAAPAAEPAIQIIQEQAAVADGTTAQSEVVTVFKTPTCGCCAAWVDHMREAGFTVETQDLDNLTPIKEQYGVSPSVQSCHTAVVDGYVIEGHVPAVDVKRLLAERPDVAGLAVPGMPSGSPGMEAPGRAADPFDVLAFTDAGEVEVFASYR